MMPQGCVDKSPSDEVIEVLDELSSDPKNIVFIVSGRGRDSLSKWFSPCEKLGLSAEYGYFTRTSLLMATNRSSLCTPLKYRGNAVTATNPSQSTNANSTATIQSCFFNSSLLKWKVMNNRCAKFKSKLLEHVDLMEWVYSGATVTRKHAWTPIEVCDDAAVAATNAMDVDSGMGPLSAGTPLQPGHDTVGDNVVDSSLFEDAPPQSAVDGSANPKRHKRVVPGTVASNMDNLVEVVSKQSRELKITQYVVTGKCDNIVGDCLARLMSTPGLEPGGKLFSFTCGIMDSPNNWDIIMALSQNYIVNWLTEKRACTPANVGRDHEGGTRLFESGGVVDLD
ncbi:putative alpha,alpha-trehalose-phosphate synthase [UDP-forming] 7 [Camellia lanceoleosa]|uniref:Alpha,alpha-trehalose-phosphate synthase [UDP-forming] 7 n=1 Tax=Camellia lanceoleosa TaxID=1840588 RepID=A0ACC0HRA0_9ERIC|nr:putative alpha,alpha-trehalose-phosphate synthase [UDP-forming] 7 [Camellia lanceoleosa]